MSRERVIAELLRGAQASHAEFITVRRLDLVAALTVPEPTTNTSSEDEAPSHEKVSRRQGA